MTNIVGGNTGNLSQPNTPQEGSSGKSIGTGTGLDFLSLISTVDTGQKSLNTQGDKVVVNKESIHTNQVPASSIGLPNSGLNSSELGGNIISDDVSNFLKALNLSNDGNNSSVGLSTLNMLNHVANSGEVIGTNQVVSFSPAAKEFLHELLTYLKIHSGELETVNNLSKINLDFSNQIIDLGDLENFNSQNFTSLIETPAGVASLNDFVKSKPATVVMEQSFNAQSEGIKLFDPSEQLQNSKTINLYFNTDIESEQSLNQKGAIEIKVQQKPEALFVKVFDIDSGVRKVAGEILTNYDDGLKNLPSASKNILNIDASIENRGLIIVNVEIDDQGKSNFVPFPIYLNSKAVDQTSSDARRPSSNLKHDISLKIAAIKEKPASSLPENDSTPNINNLGEAFKSNDKSLLAIKKIDLPSFEHGLKIRSENIGEIIKLSFNSNTNQFLSNDQSQFLAEKLKQTNDVFKNQIVAISEINNFIPRKRGNFAVEAAVSKVMKGEFKLSESTSTKKNLFSTAADIIDYRKEIGSLLRDNQVSFKDHSYFETLITDANTMKIDSKSTQLKDNDIFQYLAGQESKSNPALFDVSSNRLDQFSVKPQVSSNVLSPQKLNVLDAQFSSRMATSFLEQAINSKENFDLILEPESFGKVRVNVSLESLQLDVKLTAENSATLAILRASESVLQSITEMNGLKLAEYNVELSNNNQNNSGSKDQKENSGEKDVKMSDNRDDLDEQSGSSKNDSLHSLNLIA